MTGDKVEIKEFNGGQWKWTGRKGHVIDLDEHCYTVMGDDGERVRDVKVHFRRVAQ